MDILEQQTRKADMDLLEQYRKELSDLENGRGLAKCMSLKEIVYAKAVLIESINGFRGYLY